MLISGKEVVTSKAVLSIVNAPEVAEILLDIDGILKTKLPKLTTPAENTPFIVADPSKVVEPVVIAKETVDE